MNQTMPFGEVLDAAEQLSQEEQHELVAILNRRLAEAARKQIALDVQEARQQLAEGKCQPATADELMREIMK
jgi:hypothetical protein